MNNGRLLAIGMIVATIVFIVYGTLFPLPSASAFGGATSRLRSSATAQAAVENLGDESAPARRNNDGGSQPKTSS